MILDSFLLHAGREGPFVEYRVLLFLVSFGGIGPLAYWLRKVIDPLQSRFVPTRDGEEVER